MNLKNNKNCTNSLCQLPITFVLALGYLIASCQPAIAQIDTAHGASLFQRCSGCHKLDIQLVGPALGPQITEETDDQYLVRWIHNSQALVTANEPRALAIYNRFNQSIMPAFNELSNKDISDILGYVRAKWKDVQAASKNKSDTQAIEKPDSSAFESEILLAAAVCLSVLCLLVILIMFRALQLTEQMLGQRHSGPPK